MTGNDDHDLLIRIETKLDRALGDLSDIDERVSVLERSYWKVAGGVSVVVVAVNVIIKLFFK